MSSYRRHRQPVLRRRRVSEPFRAVGRRAEANTA